MKKITIILLSAMLLVGCTAPSNSDITSNPTSNVVTSEAGGNTQQAEEFTLAYSKKSGTNPYLTDVSVTHQLAQLIFTRMVDITDEYKIEYLAAESITVSGTSVIITPSNAEFSDGTPIRAEDLSASISAAKASSVYAGRFANVVSTKAENSTVILELAHPDASFQYLLDIPIIKESEAAIQNPTASGRYLLDSENSQLIPTPSFADKAPFDTIKLEEFSSNDAIVAGMNIGSLSLHSSAEDNDLTGSNVLGNSYHNMNNLIYLGVNASHPDLYAPAVRQAVSSGVARRQLADRVYYSRAYVASNVANAHYPFIDQGNKAFDDEADSDEVDKSLQSAGYILNAETKMYERPVGKPITIDLLCYSGNTFKRYMATLVKEQLAHVGITINIVEEADFTIFNQKIASGQFALYIGEIKLYNNIDLSPFFDGGAVSGGIAISDTLRTAYNAMTADVSQYQAFETAFVAEMPFIPLLYKNGVVTYNKGYAGFSPTISDAFYNFENIFPKG